MVRRFSVVAAILAAALAGEAIGQGVGIYNPATGRRYAVTPLPGDFAQARQQAEAMGGKLASLADASEASFVAAVVLPLIPFGATAFVGLSDEVVEGAWLWDDGTPATYLPWAPGQPDDAFGQDAARLYFDGTLDDIGVGEVGWGIVEGKVLADVAVVADFEEDFSDNSAGWTLGPEWQIGGATPSSGQAWGSPDPGVDADGVPGGGVAGVMIGGNAPKHLHDFYWLTGPVIPTTSHPDLVLAYERFLNSDYPPYMTSVVEVFDGVSWVGVFDQGTFGTFDAQWTTVLHPIGAYANPNFQVRFGFRIDDDVWVFDVSSWNLDNVRVGLRTPAPTVGAYAALGGGTGSLGIANIGCPPNALAVTAIALGAGNVPNGWFFGLDIPAYDLVAQMMSFTPPFVTLLDAQGRSMTELPGGVPPGITISMVTVPLVGGIPTGVTAPIVFTTH
ncbi:MAG TPA: C-type lectin domain-containing protein [Planctomycetota bacterium]|nr:C-type lectin domain-containing protein [Planctomycetota bacterium]